MPRQRTRSKAPLPPRKSSRATTKRRRKKDTASSRRSKKRLVARVGAIAVLFLVLAFLLTDHSVSQILARRQSRIFPAVYSRELTLSRGDRIAPQALNLHLANRRYRQVPTPVHNPGEYSIERLKEGDRYEIFTRESYTSDGSLRQSRRIRFNPHTGSIDGASEFTLEPQILAPLVGSSLRVDRFVPLDQMPDALRNAFLSIEDQRFYHHFGIDPLAVARAVITNARAGRWVQGGSTITQQLAKNLFLSPEKTLLRKGMEALAAFALERQLSKDRILELYLNEVYLGQEGSVAIHGVAEAANVFFGKRVSDLSLAESALLAGLVKAPSSYSPRRHLVRAHKRKEIVLAAMRETGAINEEDHAAALLEKIQIQREAFHRNRAEYFVSALRRDLVNAVNLDSAALAGVSVYTGIDAELQQCAERAVREGTARLETQYPALRRRRDTLEGALVAIEPSTGLVRASVGGRDYRRNQYDHAHLAERPIGSTIKPFLYLTALDGALNSYKVATTMSVLPDRPLQISLPAQPSWEPENFDHQFRGDVTLRYALEHSLNIPSVYLAQKVSTPAFRDTLRNFRVMSNPPNVPALALGAAETTLVNLTAAYGAIANGGVYVAPRLFTRITDNSGEQIAATRRYEERVANEAPSYVLLDILRGAVERGTAHLVRDRGFKEPAAGKTGTSNDTRDAWFVGFTPTMVAGVWIGYDDNARTGLSGGVAAAPIWAEFMKCAQSSQPRSRGEIRDFTPPPGIVMVQIDARSGALATSECPAEDVATEVFVRGTQPKITCPLHGSHHEDVAPEKNGNERNDQRRPSFLERLLGQ